MPVNHEVSFLLQETFNLLPNLNVQELVQAFSVKTNDMMLVIYISSLIRSVIALHNLINNKLALKDAENEGEKKDNEKKEGERKEDKKVNLRFPPKCTTTYNTWIFIQEADKKEVEKKEKDGDKKDKEADKKDKSTSRESEK